MRAALFAYNAYGKGYRGEADWRFSVARPAQSATSGRVLCGGPRQSRSPQC